MQAASMSLPWGERVKRAKERIQNNSNILRGERKSLKEEGEEPRDVDNGVKLADELDKMKSVY